MPTAVASASTRGTSPLMPIIHWVTRRVASVMAYSLRHIAPITSHRMPGDKRGSLGAEPHRRFGNFFWMAYPSYGFAGNEAWSPCGIAQASCRHRGAEYHLESGAETGPVPFRR